MPRKTKTIRDRGSRNSRKHTKRVLNGGGVFTIVPAGWEQTY